ESVRRQNLANPCRFKFKGRYNWTYTVHTSGHSTEGGQMSPQTTDAGQLVFAGDGDLARRLREFDWSQSALGTVESWPQSLKTCVRIMLTARQPMFVWWGDELINLYNDAYRTILQGKHPWALGQPASLV